MIEEKTKQKIIDNEHLRLLSLFHLISGILSLLFSFFFVLYIGFFSIILRFTRGIHYSDFPNRVMSFVFFIWSFFIIVGILWGVAKIISSMFMNKRKYRIFSIIVSVLECLSVPYGTILGVMSLTVLSRESIKEIYLEKATPSEIETKQL